MKQLPVGKYFHSNLGKVEITEECFEMQRLLKGDIYSTYVVWEGDTSEVRAVTTGLLKPIQIASTEPADLILNTTDAYNTPVVDNVVPGWRCENVANLYTKFGRSRLGVHASDGNYANIVLDLMLSGI